MQGRHYRAFECLWVTLPHIWDRDWAQNPNAFAVSVGCARMRAWPHVGMGPKLFERLAFPMLTLWIKHGRNGVCHTLNWIVWQQLSLYGDCRDQLVALVKHCNGTIIKAGTQKPQQPIGIELPLFGGIAGLFAFFLSWHLWTLMLDITICLAARYWLQTPSVLLMLLGKLEPLHLGACCVSLKSAGILLPESMSSSCQSQQLSLLPGAVNVCCATGRIYLRREATAHKPSILLPCQRYASHLSAAIWAFAPCT